MKGFTTEVVLLTRCDSDYPFLTSFSQLIKHCNSPGACEVKYELSRSGFNAVL